MLIVGVCLLVGMVFLAVLLRHHWDEYYLLLVHMVVCGYSLEM